MHTSANCLCYPGLIFEPESTTFAARVLLPASKLSATSAATSSLGLLYFCLLYTSRCV